MGLIMSDATPSDKKWLEILGKDFFAGNPVSFNIKLQGQGLDTQENFVLGCRAGPVIDASNLIHEMGHLAEREIPKLLERPGGGWGFTMGKHWRIGYQEGYEFQTDQSVQREKRVWAYQWSILKHYGIKESLRDLLRSARFLAAFDLYTHRIIKEHPELEKVTYGNRQNAILAHLRKEVLELSRTEFTFQRFCQEWQNRMMALKQVPNREEGLLMTASA